jgi:hypothetical protein
MEVLQPVLDLILGVPPLVWISSVIYFLGAVNHHLLVSALLQVMELEADDSAIKFRAMIWPYDVVSTLVLVMFEPDEDEEE